MRGNVPEQTETRKAWQREHIHVTHLLSQNKPGDLHGHALCLHERRILLHALSNTVHLVDHVGRPGP